MKSIFTIIVFLILITIAQAQSQLEKMQVVDQPTLSETEIVAKRVTNGNFCAAIKVISDLEGFSYDAYLGIVGGIEDKPGQDIVYLDPKERVVLVYHTGYEPLKIILSDFGVQLKEKQLWEIKIKGGKVDILPVSFIITPKDATIEIEGMPMGNGPTFQLKTRKHFVRINKEQYYTIEDTVTVEPDNVLFIYHLAKIPELVLVDGGAYKMGSALKVQKKITQQEANLDIAKVISRTFVDGQNFRPEDCLGDGDKSEKDVHDVEISSFYIGKYEVTFAQYDIFCDETNKKKPRDNGWERQNKPIMNVSWFDAIEFCNWLSKKAGLQPCYKIEKINTKLNKPKISDFNMKVEFDFDAKGYRLPTEAEWEYVCRGGTKSKNYQYSGSNYLDEVAVYSQNSTSVVGTKKPNELGIFDMCGNVSEWCWDWYDESYYKQSPIQNPDGPETGSKRVFRGGSWYSPEKRMLSTHRNYYWHGIRSPLIGFRICKNK